MRRHTASAVLLLVVLCGGAAQAQEKRHTGLTFAVPASVGVIVHATDSFAVRPDFTFTTSSTDANSGTTNGMFTSSNWSLGFGVSALYYVRTWEKLKAYVVPRFSYSRLAGNSSGGSASVTGVSEGTGNSYGLSGALGAQYALGRRFSVFAETGIVYAWVNATTTNTATLLPSGSVSTATSTTEGRGWGMRAGVGGILYF